MACSFGILFWFSFQTFIRTTCGLWSKYSSTLAPIRCKFRAKCNVPTVRRSRRSLRLNELKISRRTKVCFQKYKNIHPYQFMLLMLTLSLSLPPTNGAEAAQPRAHADPGEEEHWIWCDVPRVRGDQRESGKWMEAIEPQHRFDSQYVRDLWNAETRSTCVVCSVSFSRFERISFLVLLCDSRVPVEKIYPHPCDTKEPNRAIAERAHFESRVFFPRGLSWCCVCAARLCMCRAKTGLVGKTVSRRKDNKQK